MFWCQNAGGYQKQRKSFGVLSRSKTLFFFVFFLQRSGTKTLVFFRTSQGFGSILEQKPYQNHGGSQKTTVFGAKTLEGTKKNPKEQSFGVWSCQTTQRSKTLCFFFFCVCVCVCFLVPPCVLVPKLWFFGTPQMRAFWSKTRCQNAGGYNKTRFFGTQTVVFWYPSRFWEHFGAKALPKPWRVPKNHGFWCQNAGYQQKPKRTKFWSLELPNYRMLQDFVFFGFFCTLQRFGTKNRGFLGPSMVLARLCSKMLPKH